MARLVLGVVEMSYTNNEGAPTLTTTGDVATILESQHHVMQTFYDSRKGRIAEFLADGMGQALQDLFHGRSAGAPGYDAAQKIEREFRSFIFANEMQKLSIALTGAPVSAAAQAGVSHRKKHPYAQKNRSRPAFVDTGLYVSSFRAEIKL